MPLAAATEPSEYHHGMYVVSAAVALSGIAGGGVLIDVRSRQQFEADAWPGSASLPLDEITAGEVPAVARGCIIYTVCAVGGFSELAALYLREAGFTAVYSVRGGLRAMRALQGDGHQGDGHQDDGHQRDGQQRD